MRRRYVQAVGDPARKIDAPDAPRASVYAQETFAHLGLTPEQLYALDMDLAPPLTAEEREEFLRDAETWASPEQLEQFKRDLDGA